MSEFAYGQVWMVELEPIVGHEQGGKRPAVLLSRSDFNAGPAKVVVVVPITSKARNVETRVAIEPPDGGLTVTSYAIPESIRSVSHDRMLFPIGTLSDVTLGRISEKLRILLSL